MSVMYDKLLFMRRLEGEGLFSRPQAEALSEAFDQAVSESIATKSDLAEVRHEIGLMRSELKLWTGSMAVALFAALFSSLGGLMTIFKFLVH